MPGSGLHHAFREPEDLQSDGPAQLIQYPPTAVCRDRIASRSIIMAACHRRPKYLVAFFCRGFAQLPCEGHPECLTRNMTRTHGLFSKSWAFFGYSLYYGRIVVSVPKWDPDLGNYPPKPSSACWACLAEQEIQARRNLQNIVHSVAIKLGKPGSKTVSYGFAGLNSLLHDRACLYLPHSLFPDPCSQSPAVIFLAGC